MRKKFVAAVAFILLGLLLFGCESQQENAESNRPAASGPAEQTGSKAGRRSEGNADKA